MLTTEERHLLRTSRVARFYEMERQFEVVTAIYPAQRLTIFVNSNEIIEILNCTRAEAVDLINKIGMKEWDGNPWRIRTSVLCDHLNIDEMLIQVFLASLSLSQAPLPPKERLPALTMEQITVERPHFIFEHAKQLQNGILENTKTYAIRARRYEEANPMGEPMYKRDKWVQMVIRAFEVAQIYGCHIDTAQEMLREVREKDLELFGKSRLRRYVSIKRFCEVHNEDEQDIRKHLAMLHGPDDDGDDN